MKIKLSNNNKLNLNKLPNKLNLNKLPNKFNLKHKLKPKNKMLLHKIKSINKI